jgi:two-component system, chemotaxis family, chemotaxis protein CheY
MTHIFKGKFPLFPYGCSDRIEILIHFLGVVLEARRIQTLIIDDDRNFSQVLQKKLGTLGFTKIQIVDNGHDGLKAIEDNHLKGNAINLVFCDWQMPACSGLEVIRSIRSHPLIGGLTFVMVTGRTDDEHIAAAFAADVDAYIKKPAQTSAVETILLKLYLQGKL